jgi:hypothetical protein
VWPVAVRPADGSGAGVRCRRVVVVTSGDVLHQADLAGVGEVAGAELGRVIGACIRLPVRNARERVHVAQRRRSWLQATDPAQIELAGDRPWPGTRSRSLARGACYGGAQLTAPRVHRLLPPSVHRRRDRRSLPIGRTRKPEASGDLGTGLPAQASSGRRYALRHSRYHAPYAVGQAWSQTMVLRPV